MYNYIIILYYIDLLQDYLPVDQSPVMHTSYSKHYYTRVMFNTELCVLFHIITSISVLLDNH